MAWPQSGVTAWWFKLLGFRLDWIVVQSFFLLGSAVTATPPVVQPRVFAPMPEDPEIGTPKSWAPSTLVLWGIFLLLISSLALTAYLRLNIASILVAIVATAAWTVMGRRWFRHGFHQAFDMLGMFVYVLSFAALVIAVYRFCT